MTIENLNSTTMSLKDTNGEFPTVPTERMNVILSGGVNSGPKCIIILQLAKYPSYAITSDLTADFRRVVSNTGTHLDHADATTVSSFCASSLTEVGLVSMEVGLNSGGVQEVIGFAITEAGRKFGVPAASLAMNFEVENPDISLYQVFGQTASRDENNRAPGVRASVLLSMADLNVPVAEGDLARAVGVAEGVRLTRSLRALKHSDCVNEHVVSDNQRKVFQLTRSESPLNANKKSMVRVIYERAKKIQEKDGSFTVDSLSAELREEHGGGFGKKGNFEKYIRRCIQNLKRSGHVIEQTPSNWQEPRIEYSLTEKGKRVVRQFLNPLFLIMDGNTQFLENFRNEVVAKVDRNFTSMSTEVVRRYYPYSQSYKRQETAAVYAKLIEVFKESGKEGLTKRQLVEITGQKAVTLNKRLTELAKKRIIRKAKSPEGKNMWYRVEQEESPVQ